MTTGRESATASERLDQVERHVLEKVTPDAAFLARVARVRTALVARVEEVARERKSPISRALIAGSAARGTFLNDRLDIDLFLLFPPDLSRAELGREGLALGEAILENTETRYAEHPYRRGWFEGFQVDAVPGYAVKDPSQPLSAVDRTPFHHQYLTERLSPERVDQVRLTKQFLRALGIYGSDARTEGLSGYLVELFVVEFGSLRGLLQTARGWRIPVNLRPGEAPPRLPADVALILSDPVDPNRNVASALSRRNLATLVLAANAYLSNPSEAWFEPTPEPRLSVGAAREKVEERGTQVVALLLERPKELVDDILYPQLRKAERSAVDLLRRAGFTVLGSASAADEGLAVLVEVDPPVLPAAKIQDGPPAGIDRAGAFLSKWGDPRAPTLQGPYVGSDGKLAVDVRRSPRSVEDVLTREVASLPLGRDLRAVVGSARVVALAELSEAPEVASALAGLLGKRLQWLPRS